MTPRSFVFRLGLLLFIAGLAFAVSGTYEWGFPLMIVAGVVCYASRSVRKSPAAGNSRL